MSETQATTYEPNQITDRVLEALEHVDELTAGYASNRTERDVLEVDLENVRVTRYGNLEGEDVEKDREIEVSLGTNGGSVRSTTSLGSLRYVEIGADDFVEPSLETHTVVYTIRAGQYSDASPDDGILEKEYHDGVTGMVGTDFEKRQAIGVETVGGYKQAVYELAIEVVVDQDASRDEILAESDRHAPGMWLLDPRHRDALERGDDPDVLTAADDVDEMMNPSAVLNDGKPPLYRVLDRTIEQ